MLAPKHVENDGGSHVDRPKVAGFTPYLAGMLKTMIAIGGHLGVNSCIFTCANLRYSQKMSEMTKTRRK